MWQIDEDAYWERVREEREVPSKYAEPYLEQEYLFLDDEIEQLEENTVAPWKSCTRAIWRTSFWK